MTPDTFMDSFPLVRNSLEKQGTWFREAFPTEIRVAIAFRISHQRCSIRPEACNFIKKETLAQVFSCKFCEISKSTFFKNTSGQMLLCFMAFSDWDFLPQHFKNTCYWKIDCGKHYRLSKHFIKFPRTSSGTAKAVATFKGTTNCIIPQAVSAIWAPGTDFS